MTNFTISVYDILCTTVLFFVSQFYGSGGLSKCEGTTQEEAIKNQMITDREEVKAYYNVFILEDKNGKLTLDHLNAADHVHTVLKRTEEAQCNLSRYLIVSNPNPSPKGSGYPNFNIRNITIPTVGTHSCMFTSAEVAFFTRLLSPFLLLLLQ